MLPDPDYAARAAKRLAPKHVSLVVLRVEHDEPIANLAKLIEQRTYMLDGIGAGNVESVEVDGSMYVNLNGTRVPVLLKPPAVAPAPGLLCVTPADLPPWQNDRLPLGLGPVPEPAHMPWVSGKNRTAMGYVPPKRQL